MFRNSIDYIQKCFIMNSYLFYVHLKNHLAANHKENEFFSNDKSLKSVTWDCIRKRLRKSDIRSLHHLCIELGKRMKIL